MNDIFQDLYIFEMANNHQGIIEHGLNIIKEMGKLKRKYNIKASVKFQFRDLETMIHPKYINSDKNRHIKRFLSTKLTRTEFQQLCEEVKKEEMITIATPFDETSVKMCLDLGIQIIKVASCSANDWPLLEEIALTRKPIIISTAGKSITQIDKIYNFFTHRNCTFALMHCVGLYPTPNNMLQLDMIEKLKKRYPNVVVGYSGHEGPTNTDVVKIAIAKGAKILERHVGIETDEIKLNKYSMKPEETDDWINSSLIAKDMCYINRRQKYISQDEIESMRSLSRGVYAIRDIKKGESINKNDVFFAMPCLDNQMTSEEFYHGMIASRDYMCEEAIYEPKKIDTISIVRNIIHDAKGMLFESKVVVGDRFEIELSHHYGIEHFRQTGAIIVNVVNREYCKKILIMLEGQNHPTHYHNKKEETFQLLWGDLEVVLDNKRIIMKPGDTLIVERGKMHSFLTVNGAIFEEISTTHIRGDSFYEDERINKLDPIERKTILEDW